MDLQAEVYDYRFSDDYIRFTARNLSTNSDITFYVEFTITDICGKSHTEWWPGGVTLKNGGNDATTISLGTGCKKGDLKSSIAKITCKVTGFKDLTKDAKAYKEKQLQDQQKRDEERVQKQKLENDKLKKEADARRERETANNATTNSGNNTSNTSSGQPATSYYNTQRTTTSAPRQPTYQERDAQIRAENQRIYQEQQTRIAETQRRSQQQSEEFVDNATELIGMVGNLIEQGRINREKKEAKEAEQRQREQQRRQEEAEKAAETARYVAQRLELRNSLINDYSDGGVPLSSQKIGTKVLFYFTYIFDKNTIAESRPNISVSNIFSIFQYSDGTWPFKSSIQNDIKKIGESGAIILVGYFTTNELAEEARNNFLDIAGRTFFEVKPIVYNSKKNNSTAGTDFWGDKPEKPAEVGKATFRPGGMGDEDFWETGQYRKKIKEESKKEEAKKAETKKPTTKQPKTKKTEPKKMTPKDDFWNN